MTNFQQRLLGFCASMGFFLLVFLASYAWDSPADSVTPIAAYLPMVDPDLLTHLAVAATLYGVVMLMVLMGGGAVLAYGGPVSGSPPVPWAQGVAFPITVTVVGGVAAFVVWFLYNAGIGLLNFASQYMA